jgi:hypothetical protein
MIGRAYIGLVFACALALTLIGGRAAAEGAGLHASHPDGSIRALVVGIDDYTAQPKLKGAVADARDMASSLRFLGVTDVTVLIDQEATREAFVAAMNRLVRDAKPNDFVIVSFAGHGAQLKESVKDSKPDHLDEVYVLAKFDARISSGFSERVIGPEMKHWIGELDRKGVEVLFVADTCHGGGLTRDHDPRDHEYSYRTIQVQQLAQDELHSVATPADSMLDESAFAHLTFLAAVDRYSKAPEVAIDGQSTLRGALSYAVARALLGVAAKRGDGTVTRRDLIDYVRLVVKQYAETRQHIYYEPHSAAKLDTVVYRSLPAAAAPTAPATASSPRRSLRVAVINGDTSALAEVKPLFTRFEITDKADADFIWDAGQREVIFMGDVIARGISADDVPGVADRIAAGRTIATLAERRPQNLQLLPNDALHRAGEILTLEATELRDKYLVVFNIAGDGTTQFLFPHPADSPRVSDSAWRLKFRVAPPFGADEFVVITSDERLTDFESRLKIFDRRRTAGMLPDAIRDAISASRSARIGMTRVVTAP